MYRKLSLLRLTELIVHNGDSKALEELHNHRKVFYYQSAQPLRLAEFVDKLHQRKSALEWCDGDSQILENAYDLTISKFSHLPNPENNHPEVKPQGPDCRYYFEAFVRKVSTMIDNHLSSRAATQERQMAKLLQNLIVRHFRLSCKECQRQGSKLTTRYRWQVNGYALELFLPLDMQGRQRGRWLTDHIPDVDPTRPGERERVQAIVDDLTGKRKILSLENIEKYALTMKPSGGGPQREQDITVQGLAKVVAEEKAENIERQRDAIEQLGQQKLRQLIHSIFDSLADGRYEAAKIADKFKINRATFSRFAGSRWLSRSGQSQKNPIPDLWFNVAQTLAGHPVFVSVAEDSGLLGRVEQVLANGQARKRNGT